MENILLYAGVAGMVLASIWSYIIAFRRSLLLGVVALFLNFLILYVWFVEWPETKRPVLLYFSGFALILLAAYMGPCP